MNANFLIIPIEDLSAALAMDEGTGAHRADTSCTVCGTDHWSPEAELQTLYHQQQVALLVGEDLRPQHRAATEAEASFDAHADSAVDVANGCDPA